MPAMYDAHGCHSRHQIRRNARRNVLGLSKRRLPNEDVGKAKMDNDFLDGIDDQFQRLMKLNGNGKRNGHSMGRSKEDRLVTEIVDHLHNLSKAQQEAVLTYIRSLQREKVE